MGCLSLCARASLSGKFAASISKRLALRSQAPLNCALMFCRKVGLLSAVCLTLASTMALAQGKPEVIERIITEGKEKSQAFKTISKLVDEVGHRVTGSKALDKGIGWAMEQFRRAGVDKVWKEQWGTIPETFDRGPNNSVRMVSTYTRDFVFTTPCWTYGTKGKVTGPLAKMPATVEDLEKQKPLLKGAFVLMPTNMGMRGPNWNNRTDVDKALDAAGIAGRVYSSGRELVWTSGSWMTWKPDSRPNTPLIVVRQSDFDAALYNIEKGRSPMLEAQVDNRIDPKPMPVYNVIAEIKGTEKPDEIVIICGHFDSWNGPGSQGASDNGTGTAATLEAARILAKSKVKPKRTIRFILWTGEEQGLLGSRAYCETHKDEMSKISALLNEDSGQNPHAAILGLPAMMETLNEAVAPMKTAFPDYPVEVREVRALPRGGSDHGSFLAKGVPGFFLVKKSIKDYGYIWHTQNDRVDQVEDLWLRQMATNLSVIAYNLAEADEMLPRVPMSATVYDPHAVGGVDPILPEKHDDHTCTCSISFELKLHAQKIRLRHR